MRDLILAAVESGKIEELGHAIEWNELPPEFGDEAGDDPIGYWKTLSGDGNGRNVLEVLGKILALPPARLQLGHDPENNTIYVWPYLAERPLDNLTATEQALLATLMPESEAKSMVENKKWTWWRLAIDAGGSWLTFMRHR